MTETSALVVFNSIKYSFQYSFCEVLKHYEGFEVVIRNIFVEFIKESVPYPAHSSRVASSDNRKKMSLINVIQQFRCFIRKLLGNVHQ